jgi:hypothetical protein
MLRGRTREYRMHPMNRIIITTLAGIVLAILASTTSVYGQTHGASVLPAGFRFAAGASNELAAVEEAVNITLALWL